MGLPKWVRDRMPYHLGKVVQGVVRKELLKQYREMKEKKVNV